MNFSLKTVLYLVLMDVLVKGLLYQDSTDWVAYKQHNCISHSSGAWMSEIKAPLWLGVGLLLGHKLLFVP